MTDISTLVGGPDRSPRVSGGQRARVVKPPTALDTSLTVSLLSYTNDYEYEVPATNWISRGTELPVKGAVGVAVFDDHGDTWFLLGGGTEFPAGGGGGGDETDPIASAALTAHAADTTAIHGIANTALLVVTSDPRLSDARTPTAHTHDDRYFTEAEVTSALAAKQDAATAATDAELTTHAADTTAVHGIADTSLLIVTSDARLSDARTPTAHKASHASGGSDALTGNLDAVGRTNVKKAGTTIGTRRGLNLIEGTNITLTVADDAANEEVDVTIAAAGGGAGPTLITGSGAPAAGTGANGQIYLDLASLRMWGPKAAGAWPGAAFARLMPLTPTWSQVQSG